MNYSKTLQKHLINKKLPINLLKKIIFVHIILDKNCPIRISEAEKPLHKIGLLDIGHKDRNLRLIAL